MDREGAFKVCIFGDKSIAKTTLVNSFLRKLFNEDMKRTVGIEFYEKDLEIDGKNVILRIWDFAEEGRFKSLLPSFAIGADGGIFVFDINRYSTLKNLDGWLSIFEKNVREETPIVMVGVVSGRKDKRQVSAEDANELVKKFNLAMYLEISTFTEENIKIVFEELTRLIMSRVGKQEKRYFFGERTSLEASKVWKQKLKDKRRRIREEPPIKTNENKNLENDKIKQLVRQYEEETNKYAIWRGNLTEGFKRWRKGEDVCDRKRERISLYVSDDNKEEWSKFIKKNKDKYGTISKLIRESVKYFIQQKAPLAADDKNILENNNQILVGISALKEPLTSIKGFSQVLIENYNSEMKEDFFDTIKNIFNQSLLLEKMITKILDCIKTETTQYDILMIEDDLATIRLLTNYFGTKDITVKGVVHGNKVIEELEQYNPKLILTDINHPGPNGYEVCIKIKSHPKWKNIPVFFFTAQPGSWVEKFLAESKADGYILKPFAFSDFDIIINLLKN